MDPSDVAQLVVILVLIGLSAFFSSAETSLTTCNRIHILSLAEEGSRKAKTLLKVVENSGKMLSTILIGNNIVNISASALMTTLTTEVLGSQAVGIGTGILTLLILIFGEITPKTVATVNPDGGALLCACHLRTDETFNSGHLPGQQTLQWRALSAPGRSQREKPHHDGE